MSHFYRRVRRGLAVAVVLGVFECAAIAAQAAEFDAGAIHITAPWVRATPKGASTGAGYMTITNTGATADRLSCVSTEAAARCQIHSMTMEGGVMKMRPVEGGLEIKPGGTVTLKPSGLHVMFVDLKHPLEQGKEVEATFKLEHAGTVRVVFPVVAIGAAAPGVPAGGSMMQGNHGSMMQGNHGGMMQMNKH